MQHIYKTSWKTSLKANLSPIYLLYPVHQACVTVVCIKLVNQIYEIFHKMDKKKKVSHRLIIMTMLARYTHNAAEANQNIYHSLPQFHTIMGFHY